MTSNFMYPNSNNLQNEVVPGTFNHNGSNNISSHLIGGSVVAQPTAVGNPLPIVQKREQVLRTPLSLLNEVCSKAKTIPQFEMSEEGPVHNRRYDCKILVEKQGFSWNAKGSGRTKKDAKQEAAKALLLDMDQQVEKLLVPQVTKEQSTGPAVECDPEVPGNPVGELNELCLSIKRIPPEYEDVAEIGKPHERVYTVSCKLGSKLIEFGRGKSKKHAKRAAAHSMLKHVRELMKQAQGSNVIQEEEDNLVEKLGSLAMANKKLPKSWKLADIATAFRSRSGPKLDSLQDVSATSNIDPLKFLREVGEEQSFKIEFMDVERDPENSQFHSLISLCLDPIVILFGVGGSKTQARKQAADEAIRYLRVITRK